MSLETDIIDDLRSFALPHRLYERQIDRRADNLGWDVYIFCDFAISCGMMESFADRIIKEI